ncbi:unnamed protein product [Darwinula stevensoni]|uniref:Uncharacterized protein n=1 Tax=Darwinula stevensoni TaxID=69355 RepID=A0A7R8X983_9CRUS|nr:unnamed protein product [Darwinula stevensoni]CAG0890875.1 unnamed protein product [Darwinula stevensoni]
MAQFVEVTVSEQTFLGAQVEDKVLLILRRELRTLKDLYEKWELIYARLSKLEKLLQNLWEQRELSIKFTNVNPTILQAFPDLSDALLFRIQLNIEEDLNSMKEILKEFGEMEVTVRDAAANIDQVHNFLDPKKGLAYARPTPLRPSIYQMLEWGQELAEIFQIEFSVTDLLGYLLSLH